MVDIQCLVGALTTCLLISSGVTSSKQTVSHGQSAVIGDGAFAISTHIVDFRLEEVSENGGSVQWVKTVVLCKTSSLDHRAFES